MRRLTFVGAVVACVVALAAPAFGLWSTSTSAASAGSARAMTMPAGETPTGTPTGSSVALTWAPTTSPPADGYVIHSYDAATDTPRAVGAACAGVVASSSCTETGVPDGTWYYTVTPALGNWRGTPSAPSSDVTVEVQDPAPLSVELKNGAGGTAGTIDPNTDRVVITFSEPLAVSSLCSAWSDDDAGQEISGSGVTVNIDDNGGDNVLTVTTPSTCHLGTVGLGTDYLLGSTDATFTSSTVEWLVGSRSLVITLGDEDAGTSLTSVAAATVTYTPNGSVTDRTGNPIVTTPITTTDQRF